MKLKSLFTILTVAVFFTACEKGVEPVDGSRATVELRSGGKGFITESITVNPKDSIFFDFTITSSDDMAFVGVQKNPVNQTAFIKRDTLNASNKNSYSTIMRFRADSANGSYVYRIAAHSKTGEYIGHKDVVITVSPDFNYYTNRFLYAPDSTAKTNKCYFSALDGVTYSYTTGASKSASIDFGFFYDTTKVSGTALGLTLYALNSSPTSVYDLSSWTKNATVFKKLSSGSPNPTFANVLSAGTLRTAGLTQLASGTTTRVTGLSTTSPNNTVYFRTASGKIGMLLVNFGTVTTNAFGGVDPNQTYINVDVKIEK